MYLIERIKDYMYRYETKDTYPELHNLLSQILIEIFLLQQSKKRLDRIDKKKKKVIKDKNNY